MRRPSWNAATIVEPKEKLSGSTAVSCWLSGFVYGSTESRRATVSQRTSRSPRSALDEVDAGAAVDPVGSAERGLHEVVAAACGDPVGRRSSEHEPGAVDRRGSRRRGQDQHEQHDKTAHRRRQGTRAPGVSSLRVNVHEVDVLVVGSGFGGSVAALRLTEKGYRVAVLESGRRFGPGDFARTNWNLRRYLFMPRLGLRGIQRMTLLDDLVVLSGAGVGGGSLVYANTLYEPLDPFFDDRQWAGIADWREELHPYYTRAREMLGGVETPFESHAEVVVREVARRLGVEDTFRRTVVAVDFDRCTRCGGCMVGCRFEAKNTLDRNYLRLAEQGGAVVHAEREATLLRRAGNGWEVETVHPGAWVRKRRELFRAEQVVLAAGVLGTLKLLFQSGLGGPNLGLLVRSNSEAIVGAAARDTAVDYSEGIAIGSSFRPNPETHIEPVRYPKGSSMMGLFSTILVDGGGGCRGRCAGSGAARAIRGDSSARTPYGTGRSAP